MPFCAATNPSTCFSVSLICVATTCADTLAGKLTKATAIATMVRRSIWYMAEPPRLTHLAQCMLPVSKFGRATFGARRTCRFRKCNCRLAYPVLLVSKYVANVTDPSIPIQFPPNVPFLALTFSSEFTYYADPNSIRSDGTILLKACARGAETSQSMNLRSRDRCAFRRCRARHRDARD